LPQSWPLSFFTLATAIVLNRNVVCRRLGAGLSRSEGWHLCGLWGFFVTGPIAFSVAILLIAIVVYSIPPAAKPDDDNSN
jgi:type IV secretory pathway VirB2 component (pilin)